jgi:hypothetical protein
MLGLINLAMEVVVACWIKVQVDSVEIDSTHNDQQFLYVILITESC